MVRTRIAPSPTGQDIHIGNLYTAYINWAFARKHGGTFIVRIEDTDRARYVEGSEETILQSFEAFGIDHDESVDKKGEYGPYRQSERLDIYKKHAAELIQQGKAYYCICSKDRLTKVRKEMIAEKKVPKYDKQCLHNKEEVTKKLEQGVEHVIRLNVPPDTEVTFQDEIRGDISINTNNIDDQVLMKSDGFPTYHLAVVIDDHLMKISHVIRAEEWISSTPKHILLYRAFGWELPVFAHLPILRNPDKSKLSKRKNPVWASWYLEQGYLPEAILNYLALMGWSHPEEKEIFSKDEFIQVFTLERVSPVGPAFDPVKLEWMNGQYIMKLSDSNLESRILNFYKDNNLPKEIVKKSVPLVKERIKKLSDYWPIAEFFFQRPEEYEKDISGESEMLEATVIALKNVTVWSVEQLGETMVGVAKKLGISNGKYFMTMRIAITGKKVSPPLNESMVILGKEECLKRIGKV